MHLWILLLFIFIFKIEIFFAVRKKIPKPVKKGREYLSTIKIQISSYPKVERNSQCKSQKLFGELIRDPYCIFENPSSKETTDYIKNINNFSKFVLEKSLHYEDISRMVKKYSNYETFDKFEKHGSYYYFMYKNNSLNYGILKRRLGINGSDENFINPDKAFEIKNWKFSRDGSLMAYDLYNHYKSKTERKFINSKGHKLDDTLKNISTSDMAFIFENTGFIYSNYKETISPKNNPVLYYHKLGTDQSKDVVISDKSFLSISHFIEQVSSDGKYLFVGVYDGKDKSKSIYYCELSKHVITESLKFKLLIKNTNNYVYGVIDSYLNDVYVYTNEGSEHGKVIKVTINKSGSHIKTDIIKSEANRFIDKVVPVGSNYLAFTAFVELQHHVYFCEKTNGKIIKTFTPTIGFVKYLFGNSNSNEAYFTFENPIMPAVIYKVNISFSSNKPNLELEKIIKMKPENYSRKDFVVKIMRLTSKDRIKIPALIIHHKSTRNNGNNPTLLGTFTESRDSSLFSFSPSRYLFIKHFNGIVCYVNTRGSRFNGKEWFNKGIKENHNNRFEDFIHYVKSLINNNYTKPEKLAIYGSGTSGIVIANVTKQHPKLIGTSIIQGTLLDLLSLNTFDDYSNYLEEFGNPEDEEHSYLRYFSPLHNIKALKKYVQWPSTFVTGTIYPQYEITESSLKYLNELYHQLLKVKTNQTNPIIARFINIHDNQKGSKVEMHRNAINELIFISQTLDLKWKNI
uniref:Prolyl endopeptidase n=1 Tax=Parastrongyloides trichosuri TaxID=131310 RepID=A0A0N4Z869_PARTI